MKYANSLKYMNAFAPASAELEISHARALELCERLGRIHTGSRYICLPEGSAGHAIAMMLEAVIRHAGHTVGRITSVGGFDPRGAIYVNGEIPSIEVFNRAVTELKTAARKDPEQVYAREEAVFVLGQLICKMEDCDYVILEGLSCERYCLDRICAPYELIVMPTVYESEHATERVKTLCEAIRRGTREVVSGNQKSEVYNKISNACAMSGIRLYIPLKAQFEAERISSRSLEFSYSGRGGYTLRSPSHLLRDCAMTVIESALALRRGGVKIPWSSIAAGISAVSGAGCFEMLSASPIIVTDTAESGEELSLLLKTAEEVLNVEGKSLSFCLPQGALGALDVLSGRSLGSLVILCEDGELDGGALGAEQVIAAKTVKEAAKAVVGMGADDVMLCFGSVGFAVAMKSEIVRILNNR